ncbi:hypothetical protein BGZ72_010543 [Mortierella alpina]|nr:hypothetical protein BGZ72_010543 [Mortierella alpina]
MSSSLPAFSLSCLAPSNTGQSVYLFGVPSPGRLEAYSVDISDPLAPTSTLISATTTAANAPVSWDAQRSLGCYAYTGDSSTVNNPITVVQFGSTVQAQFFPNGTWITNLGSYPAAAETAIDYVSPKTFSLVGSTGGWNWLVAKASGRSSGASGWRDVRVGTRTQAASQDLTLAGSSDPLLTVGAIAQDAANFGNGFLFAFEQSGTAATAYRAVGNKRPDRNLTATELLVNLTRPSAVDMNGNRLSSSAIPVTSAFAAFILDKTLTGAIALFSIDPRSTSHKLLPSSIKGLVPPFLEGQSVTSLNSKIVVYGGSYQDASGSPKNAIHVFDVISGTWSGPALVDATAGQNGPSKSDGLSAGVLGAIAAVAALLLVILGAVFWRIRKRKSISAKSGNGGSSSPEMGYNPDSKDGAISMANMDRKTRYNRNSSTTLTPTEGAVTAPSTPKSIATTRTRMDSNSHIQNEYSDRRSRQRRPDRQASTYTVRSETSASHISLYPATSTIFLANSPSSFPPTPMVPAAYAFTNHSALQHYPQVQRGHPSPAPDHSPSRKSSVYKVLVPNDYDDRQPLHRRESADGSHAGSQQHSSTAGASSSGTPDSIHAVPWPDQGQNYLQASVEKKGYHRSRKADAASVHSRPTYSAPSSQPTSPTAPSFISEPEKSLHQQITPATTPRARKKRVPAPDYSRSATEPNLRSPTSPTEAAWIQGGHDDSSTYKVEVKDPTASQQQQRQRHQQRSQDRIKRQQSAPGLSEFPMPPKPAASPRTPRSHATQLQQQQTVSSHPDWHGRQTQLPYQQQQHEQQKQQSEADSYGVQGVRTPKMGSLPRPMPRD